MTRKLIEEVRRTGTAMVGEKQNLEDCEKLLALPVLAVTHLTTVFNNVPRWMENLRKATWEKLVKRGLEHWSTHIGSYKKEFEKFPSRSAAERSTAIEDMQTCESSLGGLANVLGKRVPELLPLRAACLEILQLARQSSLSLDLSEHLEPFTVRDFDPESQELVQKLRGLVDYFGAKQLDKAEIEETLCVAVSNLAATLMAVATTTTGEPVDVASNAYACVAKMSRWAQDAEDHDVRACVLQAADLALQVRRSLASEAKPEEYVTQPDFIEKSLHLQSCLQRCQNMLEEDCILLFCGHAEGVSEAHEGSSFGLSWCVCERECV